VVIGNPPYVELKDINNYTLKGYNTIKCGNLYAMCYERAIILGNRYSGIGYIIPVASVCTDGYHELQNLLIKEGALFVSCYNDRPGKLFEGLEHIRLAIILLQKRYSNIIKTTKYNKWNSVSRYYLFDNLAYNNVDIFKEKTGIPKIGNNIGISIFNKFKSEKKVLSDYIITNTRFDIYYTRKLSGFVQIMNRIPKIIDDKGKCRNPSELKNISFQSEVHSLLFLSSLNSSLFYWYLTVCSDCRNLNSREIKSFKLDIESLNETYIKKLTTLSLQLMDDFEMHSIVNDMKFKNVGMLKIQCFYPKKSKPIIDEIDKVLAKYYGFTEEELDFIISYDIKYRMGGELEGEE
jgi:hypothetical protein